VQLSSAEADAQAARHAMRENFIEKGSQGLAENGADSNTVVAELSTKNAHVAARVEARSDDLDAATQQLSHLQGTAAPMQAGPGGYLTSVDYATQPLGMGCNRSGWFQSVTPRNSLICRDL
jgi:ABC-type transporter Mla subunit MlaD